MHHDPLSPNPFVNPETGSIYSKAQLDAAFKLVCPKDNWKNPICEMVEYDDFRNVMSRGQLEDLIRCAVVFFCGCEPEFTWSPQKTAVAVDAPGYYAAVGA